MPALLFSGKDGFKDFLPTNRPVGISSADQHMAMMFFAPSSKSVRMAISIIVHKRADTRTKGKPFFCSTAYCTRSAFNVYMTPPKHKYTELHFNFKSLRSKWYKTVQQAAHGASGLAHYISEIALLHSPFTVRTFSAQTEEGNTAEISKDISAVSFCFPLRTGVGSVSFVIFYESLFAYFHHKL